MNPGLFFREALESHEFRSSDRFLRLFVHIAEHIFFTSDNATLLDIATMTTMRRLQA